MPGRRRLYIYKTIKFGGFGGFCDKCIYCREKKSFMLLQALDELFLITGTLVIIFPGAHNNQSEFNKFPLEQKITCFITDINIFPLLK